MTKKQLKQLAKQLAKNEYIIQTSSDNDAVRKAKESTMNLTMRPDIELDDMVKLDEMVLEILEEMKNS
jgi:hypothetical protein